MKRAVVLCAALLLLAGGVVSAEAAPKDASRRTVTIRYDQQAVYYASCGDCTEVRTLPHEQYVTVEVVDEVSGTAHLDVAWTIEPDDDPGPGYFVVCGKTATARPFPAGRELALYPWAHPSTRCRAGFSTKGKIKLTFSDRP